ncbi:unnamed protein product [Linum trigynum]|uniref:Uncharacterized protein n=1 Tax=Linum trigynum TaxID=586398 RepID=A0AAV2GNH6_9ROSI
MGCRPWSQISKLKPLIWSRARFEVRCAWLSFWHDKWTTTATLAKVYPRVVVAAVNPNSMVLENIVMISRRYKFPGEDYLAAISTVKSMFLHLGDLPKEDSHA